MKPHRFLALVGASVGEHKAIQPQRSHSSDQRYLPLRHGPVSQIITLVGHHHRPLMHGKSK